MSKPIFIIAMIASAALHAWLLGVDFNANTSESETSAAAALSETVEMVEVQQLAAEQSPMPPEPTEVEAEPEPAPAPQPLAEENSSEAETPDTPETTEAYQQFADSEAGGSFSGSKDGTQRPAIRVDWGSPRKAAEILKATGMKLVILKKDLSFALELTSENGVKWDINQLQLQPGADYSSALRVVDSVPAFSAARQSAALGDGEHLAVMLPEHVEAAIRQLGEQAATQAGLGAQAVATIGGRFEHIGQQVGFVVTHLQPRSQ